VSSNPSPAVETIYLVPLIWIKSMKAKIVEICNSAVLHLL
jgi:hypothetical protein